MASLSSTETCTSQQLQHPPTHTPAVITPRPVQHSMSQQYHHDHHHTNEATNDSTSENDPSMMNCGSILQRRRRCTSSSERKEDTLRTPPPLSITASTPIAVVTPISHKKHSRLKSSSLLRMGSTGSTSSTTIASSTTTSMNTRSSHFGPPNVDDHSSGISSTNNDNSHHHHSWDRTRSALLLRRHPSKVQNLCRRMELLSKSRHIHIFDCRNDTGAVVHYDTDSNDIEITIATNTTSTTPSNPTPSKYWRKPPHQVSSTFPQLTSPTASTISKSPMSVSTSTASSSTTIESESAFTVTPKNFSVPQQQRPRPQVRFNEEMNQIIDSELSSHHIKEYRKHMWWSNKDRVRSMKQRDVDLQNILKQNLSSPPPDPFQMTDTCTATTEQPSPQPIDRVVEENEWTCRDTNTDTTTMTCTNSELETSHAVVLSDYCRAIVTLFMYCHTQCTPTKKKVSSDDDDDTATTVFSSNKNQTSTKKMNSELLHAIRIVASSKYRGLERIVCKILQIQKVSLPLTEAERSHWIPTATKINIPMPCSHDRLPSPRIVPGRQNTDDTTTTSPDEHRRPTTTNTNKSPATTIIAHDATIEVISTVTTDSGISQLETCEDTISIPVPSTNVISSSVSAKAKIDTVLPDNLPLLAVSPSLNRVVDESLFTTSTNVNNISTAMYIRKCVLEYQNELRKSRYEVMSSTTKHPSRDDESKMNHHHRNTTNDPTHPKMGKDHCTAPVTTRAMPMSPPWRRMTRMSSEEEPPQHSSVPLPYPNRRSSTKKDVPPLEFELCQYYTSFPGHDVAIVWAQLMAMGDTLILSG